MPNFEGNRTTRTILGNMEHAESNFRFFGNMGTRQFFFREQGNRYSLGGPHFKSKRFTYVHHLVVFNSNDE